MYIHLQDSIEAQKNIHDYVICNKDNEAELI